MIRRRPRSAVPTALTRVLAAALIAVLAAVLATGCAGGGPDAQSVPAASVRVSPLPTLSEPPSATGTGPADGTSESVPASVARSTAGGDGRTSAAGSGPPLPSAGGTAATSGSRPAARPAPTASRPAGLTVTAADRAAAAAIVAGLSVTDRAAAVIMAAASQLVGTDLLSRYHFGGVILMGTRGVVDGTTAGTPQQVAAVTARLQRQAADDPTGVRPLIGTDQEYGDVVRLAHGFTDFPGAAELGAIADTDAAAGMTRQIAAAAAQELLAVGVSVDFAPVSDVLPSDGSASAIGDRSYGTEPARVGRLVAAAVTGYQHAGVAAVLKHFPGLGRVAADTHTTLPTLAVTCTSWNRYEAIPVRAGIAAGASMVMTGHVLVPAAGDSTVPASLSGRVVSGLLRGAGRDGCAGMHYSGVTVTDSLQMEPVANVYSSAQAAVRALNAGQDLLLMPLDPAAAVRGIVAAVSAGGLAASRLDQAATAVLALRLAAQRIPRPPLGVVDSPAHRALAAKARALAAGSGFAGG